MKKVLINIRVPKELINEFDKNIQEDTLEISRTNAIIRLIAAYNDKKRKERSKASI